MLDDIEKMKFVRGSKNERAKPRESRNTNTQSANSLSKENATKTDKECDSMTSKITEMETKNTQQRNSRNENNNYRRTRNSRDNRNSYNNRKEFGRGISTKYSNKIDSTLVDTFESNLTLNNKDSHQNQELRDKDPVSKPKKEVGFFHNMSYDSDDLYEGRYKAVNADIMAKTAAEHSKYNDKTQNHSDRSFGQKEDKISRNTKEVGRKIFTKNTSISSNPKNSNTSSQNKEKVGFDEAKKKYDVYGRLITEQDDDLSAWSQPKASAEYVPPSLRKNDGWGGYGSAMDEESYEDEVYSLESYYNGYQSLSDAENPQIAPFVEFKNHLSQFITCSAKLTPLMSFTELKTPISMHEYLKSLTPTPIQSYSIPAILHNSDILCRAPTGSGKTFAFLIPIILKLQKLKCPCLRVLVITPTRELALQIQTQLNLLTTFKHAVLYGGKPIHFQTSQIAKGLDIAIATPGRLCDLIKRGSINLKNIRHFVLDEADRMLEMGFEKELNFIKSHLKNNKVYLFSATFESNIRKIALQMCKNPIVIEVKNETLLNIKQTIMHKNRESDKTKTLLSILSNPKAHIIDLQDDSESKDLRILIFTETKIKCRSLENFLKQQNYRISSIHGDKEQPDREHALQCFTQGKTNILVATSVAARGLDIPNINIVINYEMPSNIKEYIHRIGRCGRCGKKGTAISFFDAKDVRIQNELIGVLKESKNEVPNFLYNLENEPVLQSSYKGRSDSKHSQNRNKPRESSDNKFVFGNRNSSISAVSHNQGAFGKASSNADYVDNYDTQRKYEEESSSNETAGKWSKYA